MTEPLTPEAAKTKRTNDAIQEVVNADPGLIRRRARADVFRRAWVGLLGITGLVSMALLIFLSLGANKAADAIADCTNPAGVCYKSSVNLNKANMTALIEAQALGIDKGSTPAKATLVQSRLNADNLRIILGILDQQYPDAAKAVRAQLSKEGTKS